jgi:hypothetical protein
MTFHVQHTHLFTDYLFERSRLVGSNDDVMSKMAAEIGWMGMGYSNSLPFFA